MKNNNSYKILLVLLYIVCGLTFIVSKYLVVSIEAPIYFFLRNFFAALFFLVVALWSRTLCISFERQLIAALLTGFLAGPLFDLWSLKYISSTHSAFLFGFSPLISSLFSHLHSPLYLHKTKFIVFAMIGFLLSFTPSFTYAPSLLPVFVCLCSVVLYSISWLFLNKYFIVSKSSIESVLFYLHAGAALGSFLLFPKVYSGVSTINSYAWIGILVSVFLSNIIFTYLYSYLLTLFSPVTLSLAGVLCPVYVSIMAWFFLGENIFTLRFILGFMISSYSFVMFLKKDTE